MTATWVDSHCHLQEQFLPEGDPTEAVDALRRAAVADVAAVVCVGTDAATSRQAVALSSAVGSGALGEGFPQVRCVVGLHPHEATEDRSFIAELIEDRSSDLVGVGECGLDYFYEHASKAEQRRTFAAQIALAHESGLALVIHAREAWDDLFDVLVAEGVPTETVLHCFTGGPAEAERCVDLGLTVSISGIVTFKNAQEVRDAVARIPLDRLLVETDAPFLAPVPHRGATNEPAWVSVVGEAVAGTLGLPAVDVAAATSANARRIFRID
jgi:TatD DNase family protein